MQPFAAPQRDQAVILDAAECRCAPSKDCHAAASCARAKAPIPRFGALQDYSITSYGQSEEPGLIGCIMFIEIHHKAPARRLSR